MDRLVGTVRSHACRYREVLDQNWQQTDWTRPQTEQVLGRMDQVLDQLPKARKQARQRILQGQLVPNQEKILSLYESDVHVIVRRKAGAEVEFGNTLLLAENPQGLILDWELFKDSAPADSALLPRTIGHMEKLYGPVLKAVGADRGFDSATNRIGLEHDKIYNGVCPRSPEQLRQRGRSCKFKRMQRRRAQTEARVGIAKNVFLGGRIRSKGFAHRELTVMWPCAPRNGSRGTGPVFVSPTIHGPTSCCIGNTGRAGNCNSRFPRAVGCTAGGRLRDSSRLPHLGAWRRSCRGT